MRRPAGWFTVLCVVGLLGCGGDSNVLGGNTDVPLGKVANRITNPGGVKVGATNVDVAADISIVANEAGVATFRVMADLTRSATLKKYSDLLPAAAKDATGKVNTEVKIKITSEGIQDYFNIDGKPHTAVKFDAKVGDKYTLTKSDGKTITRTVIARSDQDDFAWNNLLIKTITVEQDSRIPGIKKFVYRANHKFGIVYVEVVADDGSTASTSLVPSSY